MGNSKRQRAYCHESARATHIAARPRPRARALSLSLSLSPMLALTYYVVATISRFLKIIGLFCRTSSLLQGFATETNNFKEPINRSHPICKTSVYTYIHPNLCKITVYTYIQFNLSKITVYTNIHPNLC